MVGPKAKRAATQFLLEKFKTSRRRVAKALGLHWSTASYKPKSKADDRALASRMLELATKHRRFGLPRLHYLLRREGLVTNIKRTRRIYQEQRLQIAQRKKRAKQGAIARAPRPKADKVNEVWSFDFVFDRTESGRKIKVLTIVDDFSKRNPGLLVDYSISSHEVIKFMSSLGSLPKRLRCDNGPEMTSRDFLDWAFKNKIEIEYIRPGKPTENAYVESFNSRFRDECLNQNTFADLLTARRVIERWRKFYNEERPHTSIKFKTPTEFEEEWKKAN